MLAATILWGFDAWWLVVAIAILGRYLLKGGILYGQRRWGFTFPVGAMTVATIGLGQAWSLPVVGDIGFGLFVLLVVM